MEESLPATWLAYSSCSNTAVLPTAVKPHTTTLQLFPMIGYFSQNIGNLWIGVPWEKRKTQSERNIYYYNKTTNKLRSKGISFKQEKHFRAPFALPFTDKPQHGTTTFSYYIYIHIFHIHIQIMLHSINDYPAQTVTDSNVNTTSGKALALA